MRRRPDSAAEVVAGTDKADEIEEQAGSGHDVKVVEHWCAVSKEAFHFSNLWGDKPGGLRLGKVLHEDGDAGENGWETPTPKRISEDDKV